MDAGIKWLIQCGLAHDWDTYDSLLTEINQKVGARPSNFAASIIAVLFQKIMRGESCDPEIFSKFIREITPSVILNDKFAGDRSILYRQYYNKYPIIRQLDHVWRHIAEVWKYAKSSTDPFVYLTTHVKGFEKWTEITAKRLVRYPGWENLAPPEDVILIRAYTGLRDKYNFNEVDDFYKFINQEKFDKTRGIICELLYNYAL